MEIPTNQHYKSTYPVLSERTRPVYFAYSQQTQNISLTCVGLQRRPNFFDCCSNIVQMLYKCFVFGGLHGFCYYPNISWLNIVL